MQRHYARHGPPLYASLAASIHWEPAPNQTDDAPGGGDQGKGGLFADWNDRAGQLVGELPESERQTPADLEHLLAQLSGAGGMGARLG